jgi:hypothetical protein
MLSCAFIALVLLFILPFIPGARELLKKRDSSPLFINNEYFKDPRYFALSFRKLILSSLGGPATHEHICDTTLSKKEKIHVVENGRFTGGTVLRDVLYVIHDLYSEAGVLFNKEVYVRKAVHIGEANRLQALACDGDVHLQAGTQFYRWLDAGGNITVDGPCALGVRTTCAGVLSLARHSTFMKLYGFPIQIAPAQTANIDEPPVHSEIFDNKPPERYLYNIQAASLIDCCIICDESVTIGDHAVIRGHVKTHKRLVIGAYVLITGNVFAEGDIEIGSHSRVLGTIFSQAHVVVKQGVQVGIRGRIKSIIGKKSVQMEAGVRVYGYIMTEGKGLVI